MKSPMRPLPSIAAMALALATSALPASSFAQDPAAAESLFQAGRALAEEGKWAEACDKFAASFENDATIGTAFNLGECSERQGKVGSAYTWFARAKALCEEKQDARADLAEERRAKLEPRIPRLAVKSKTKAPLEVHLDGERIDVAIVTSETGLERVVDPGEHRVEVKRGSDVLATKKAKVDEAQREQIDLDLAEIERTHPVDSATPPPPPEPPPSQVPRYVGWALVGTGGLALVGATILEVAALGKQSDSEQPGHCTGTVCTPTGADEVATAGDLAEAGQWVGIAGLGLLAIGVTLVIATPSAKPAPKTGLVDPGPGAVRLHVGASRLTVGGSF